MADGTWVTPYEHKRLIQIARNGELMERLGLTAAVEDLYGRPRENKKMTLQKESLRVPVASVFATAPTSKNQTS